MQRCLFAQSVAISGNVRHPMDPCVLGHDDLIIIIIIFFIIRNVSPLFTLSVNILSIVIVVDIVKLNRNPVGLVNSCNYKLVN